MNTGHYGVKPELMGAVDIWAPNAENYDPRELALRIAAGEMTWFYHWREPFVGHMTVNTYGISMRTWDAMAFKYGVDGTFLWTANNWPHPKNWRASWGEIRSPYIDPAGANGGERWGNGTYVYPGAGLSDIGFKAIDGPVASMRLKTMRRGAQDYEYYVAPQGARKGLGGAREDDPVEGRAQRPQGKLPARRNADVRGRSRAALDEGHHARRGRLVSQRRRLGADEDGSRRGDSIWKVANSCSVENSASCATGGLSASEERSTAVQASDSGRRMRRPYSVFNRAANSLLRKGNS